MSSITKQLKKGIAFKGGIYRFSEPLVFHIQEELKKNPSLSWDNLSKIVYDFTALIGQFDYLELPTGKEYKRVK